MFTAALFTTANLWKQPKCPQMDEWIKKILYMSSSRILFSHRKNEILPSVTTWTDPKSIMLSEVSQRKKCHMISLICKTWNKTKKPKLTDTENRMVVASSRGWELEEMSGLFLFVWMHQIKIKNRTKQNPTIQPFSKRDRFSGRRDGVDWTKEFRRHKLPVTEYKYIQWATWWLQLTFVYVIQPC